MEIDGEAFEFEALGQRDHAWGNRIWGLNQHYKWFHATTPTKAVHFFELHSFGAVHVLGFVFSDAAMAQVTGGTHEFHYDEEMHHDVINARVEDDMGRSTLIECERFAKFEFKADPMIALKESAIRVRIGEEEGTGWCEFCWNRNYLDFAKQHVAQFQPYSHCKSFRE